MLKKVEIEEVLRDCFLNLKIDDQLAAYANKTPLWKMLLKTYRDKKIEAKEIKK